MAFQGAFLLHIFLWIPNGLIRFLCDKYYFAWLDFAGVFRENFAFTYKAIQVDLEGFARKIYLNFECLNECNRRNVFWIMQDFQLLLILI